MTRSFLHPQQYSVQCLLWLIEEPILVLIHQKVRVKQKWYLYAEINIHK